MSGPDTVLCLMATWTVRPNGKKKTLVFDNGGAAFVCGDLEEGMKDANVLLWVLDQPATSIGDVVLFPDGSVAMILPDEVHGVGAFA